MFTETIKQYITHGALLTSSNFFHLDSATNYEEEEYDVIEAGKSILLYDFKCT